MKADQLTAPTEVAVVGAAWPHLVRHFGLSAISAVLVRAIWLERQPYHVDELLDRNVTQFGWRTITTYPDGFPPGFYYVEKVWTNMFGLDSIRVLALLLGIAAWAFLVAAARTMWDDRTAAVTAWVAAFAPAMVWMSQELRPHSMLVTMSAAALWTMARVIRRPSSSTVLGHAAVLVAGSWTHYFVLPVAAATLLVVFVCLREVPALRWRLVAATGVGMLPLVVLVTNDLGLQQDSFGRDVALEHIGYSLLSLVTGTTVGPSTSELRELSTHDAIARTLPWLALLAIPAVLVMIVLRAHRRDTTWRSAMFVLVFGLAAVIAMMLLGGTGVRVRYVVVGVAPLVLLVGAALAAMPRARTVVAGVLLAVVAIVAIYNRNYVDTHRVADFRAAVKYIEDSDRADALVAVSQDTQGVVVDEYYGSEHALRIPTVFGPGDLTKALVLLENGRNGQGYWLLYSLPWFGDPSGLLLAELTSHHSADRVERFPGVDLYWVP